MTAAPDLEQRLTQALSRPGRASSDFDLNPDVKLAEGRRLTEAAVLIGVLPRATGPQVILTKRSSRLKHHPGQVAFPGGKSDPEDLDALATAQREAEEEIGLDPRQVNVLGTLEPHETVTGFRVTPVLALIGGPFRPSPELGEVAEVFTAPLGLVTDPRHFRVEGRRWRGQIRRYYTVPYGPYYIWGATARMLRQLADRMDP